MRTVPFLSVPRLMGALLALVQLAQADTVILKNGEKVEGKITAEDDASLTIEYKVTASISDTRTITKAEIDKVEKESDEEKTFQRLKTVTIPASAYPEATYDQILAAFQDFLTKYPKSTHAADIQKQIDAFKDEKSHVASGEIKIGGKWLAKTEAEKERYQLSGTVLLGQMQAQYMQRNFVGALNTFDNIEKTYPGAYAYADAIPLAIQITAALKPLAEKTLTEAKQRKIERDQATQLASEPQKSQLIAAQKREQEQGDAAVEAAEKNRTVKWVPFLPNIEKSLTKLASQAGTDQKRLEGLPVAKMRESMALSEKARTQVADDPTAAQESIKQATSAWPQNEVARRLQKEMQDAQIAANAPKATPAPASETAPAAAPGASHAPKKAASAKPVTATPAPAAAATEEAPVEEPKPFYTSIPFAIGMVVVLLVVFGAMNVYRKIQEKKQAENMEH